MNSKVYDKHKNDQNFSEVHFFISFLAENSWISEKFCDFSHEKNHESQRIINCEILKCEDSLYFLTYLVWS